MANLYAGSYGYGGPGFYFESSEEFDKKYKANLNKGDSAPNEEYFIEFIDGDSFEQAIFEGLGVSQGSVKEYYDHLDDVDENQMPAIFALQETGYDFDYESYGRDIRIEGGMDPANDEDQFPVQDEPDQSEFEDEDDYDEAVEQYEEFAEAEKDYDRMSDSDLGEHVVHDVFGGVEEIGEQNQQNYFDYEAFARDASLNGDWSEFRYDGTDYVLLNASSL
jgi:antirestriction protein